LSKITAYRLSRLLGEWSAGQSARAERLGDALSQLIGENTLPLGSYLPAERALANALGISRGTVTAAYAHVRDAGLIDSRQGSGHRIISPARMLRFAHRPDVKVRAEVGELSQRIDLSSGALQPSPVVRAVVATLQNRDLLQLVEDVGYFSAGLPHLRWEIARYYSELGLPTHPANILVTNGAQQALWLLSTCLVQPGDSIVVEEPTYRGALETFRSQKARLVSVPIDEQYRLDLAGLERVLTRRPKLAYLFAEVSNPLGRTLYDTERNQLADLLRRHGTFLIEDGSQNELHLDRAKPLTPIASLLDENSVATIGTMSKLFWGGLRIGWIRAARGLIETLTAFKAASDLGNSVLDQSIAVRMFSHLSEARDYRRMELQSHLELLIGELGSRSSRWSWRNPDGGTALWARLAGVNTISLRQSALRRGLLLSAGPDFSPVHGHEDSLRLAFVRPAEQVRSALDIIEQLIDSAPAGLIVHSADAPRRHIS